MKFKNKELDQIIDTGAESVRNETIDEAIVDKSSATVWARITTRLADGNSLSPESNPVNSNSTGIDGAAVIQGCADFQSLMPSYLGKRLATPRALLLEDHTNECIPCRRALKSLRTKGSSGASTLAIQDADGSSHRQPKRQPKSNWNRSKVVRWSVAAALVVGLGLTGMFAVERFDWSGRTLAATLEDTNGQVYVVSDSLDGRQLTPGAQIQKGERVRTAKGSTAVLRLADGSSIEMRERSEFSVSENRRGVTVRLDRGDVIIEAAKQDRGRLYVQTPDSLVSVKGTIFAVESGTKGSRVSVVEGEVDVKYAGQTKILLPGDQTTTNTVLRKTDVPQTVSWSRNADRYTKMVAELAQLRREINQRVALPGVRYSSKFIDVLPENTVFFAALPNLSESLAASERIVQDRIKQNPALADWWKGDRGEGFGMNEQTMARVREFGSHLGEEIVVIAEMNPTGEPGGVLILSEVKDTANFRTYLNEQLARYANESGDLPKVRIIENPADVPDTKNVSKSPELFVWINNGILAASNDASRLRVLAATLNTPDAKRLAGSAFYNRINDVYRDGAGIVVAADLEKIVSQTVERNKRKNADRERAGLERLGILDLRHFVAEQKSINGRTLSSAALTFGQSQRGVASWLAAPGSMGALDFISPDANAAVAFVVNNPALLVDDLFGFLETVDPDMRSSLQEIEKSQGISIRDDFAAPLGGEFAFAIDGPLLPTPSWKVVLEVYDQAKLQSAFERAVEKLNQFSMLHGKGKLVWENSTAGGRAYYSLKSAKTGLEVHYTFANSYLIAAPGRALLDQSVRNRDAGNSLVRSQRFKSALPPDGNMNFSAILYHDLAPLMQPLAQKMKSAGGELTEEQRQMLDSIDANAPPTLVYAYAEGDRLSLAANTEGGAFGLSPASLIGLPSSFEMQDILMNALGEKNVEKKPPTEK